MNKKEQEEMLKHARANWQLPEPLSVPKFDNPACFGLPTDWWFPDKKSNRTIVSNTKKAIEICNTCEEQFKCQNFALDNPSVHGIWGGLSVKRRSRIRSSIQRQLKKSNSHKIVYSEHRQQGTNGSIPI